MKNKLNLRVYRPFFKGGAMSVMAYKFDILTWMIVTILQVACTVFLWMGVYRNATDGMDAVINGFTYKQMLTYVVFINIFSFFMYLDDTLWQICHEIREGTIANYLLKPISYRGRFIATTLGGVSIKFLLFGLPCMAIAYVVFGLLGYITFVSVWHTLGCVAFFMVAQLLAVLLNDAIHFICGVLCFYTTATWGVSSLKSVIVNFLSGTLIPISFFPGVLKVILSYSPFVGLRQDPVLILLGQYSLGKTCTVLVLAFAWWIVLEIGGALLFRTASKKITVQGG